MSRTMELTSPRNPLQSMVKIIRCFQDGIDKKLVNGGEGDESPVTSGVKHGRVYPPTVFSFRVSKFRMTFT